MKQKYSRFIHGAEWRRMIKCPSVKWYMERTFQAEGEKQSKAELYVGISKYVSMSYQEKKNEYKAAQIHYFMARSSHFVLHDEKRRFWRILIWGRRRSHLDFRKWNFVSHFLKSWKYPTFFVHFLQTSFSIFLTLVSIDK